MTKREQEDRSLPIAIVGIGCQFPGQADSPQAFWDLLTGGVDAISDIPADRWNLEAFHDPRPQVPGKTPTRWGGFLKNIDQFDPEFFGVSPREAARMDPQQRLLLETSWRALEDAAWPKERAAGQKGAVFVGISSWDYSLLQTSFRDRGLIDVYTNTGGSLSIAANRVSYFLDLRGPSAAVDTACSSALVAVHLACQAIERDGCPFALAGGVNVLLAPDWYIGFSRLGMLSPDGRCKAFDAKGNGFVRSEGAGMVLLKPLQAAIDDGDRIIAVIRSTACNQDGHTPGLTVPRQSAQETVLVEACQKAGVQPSLVHYVEAHGPGTPVGDPIEARALGNILSKDRPADRPLLIGSVKTNIGHLEAGSGIAGLIKAALVLQHREVPPNLHFETPNPDIDFAGLKLRVPTSATPLPADGTLFAGVNSFGYGGANAHVLLASAPASSPQGAEIKPERAEMFAISAHTPEALNNQLADLPTWLGRLSDDVALSDIASQFARGRTHHDVRAAVVASSRTELIEKASQAEWFEHSKTPQIGFVCSGQGPQWWGMARGLLRDEPLFRAAIERVDAVTRAISNWSLLDEMLADETVSRMNETAISQPAIFAVQVGLAEVWKGWGIEPEMLIGHSVGEVAAAHLAGIFSLEEAARVIVHRGRCMDRASSQGRMLAAGLTADDARRWIGPYDGLVSLAAINSPSAVTLSGDAKSLRDLANRLDEAGQFCRFLQVQYAFHSPQMDPVRDDLLQALSDLKPGRAERTMISTVLGQAVEGPELDAEYWWRNVRETVLFAQGADHLLASGIEAFIELSPHPVLTGAVLESARAKELSVVALPSLRRHEDDRATLLNSLGGLYRRGKSIDWAKVYPGRHRFVTLPPLPWNKQRCWNESPDAHHGRITPPAHPLLGTIVDEPTLAWNGRLDLKSQPYLADHRVQQAVLLPATGFLELAGAAARHVLGSLPLEIEDAHFLKPCFLDSDMPLSLLTRVDAESREAQVFTRPAQGQQPWTKHFRARFLSRPASPAALLDLQAIKLRCPYQIDAEAAVQSLHDLGLDYGPLFQGIERVWRGERESLGLVRLPERLRSDGFLSHPALLDLCFQVSVFAHSGARSLFLPAEVRSLRWFGSLGSSAWCHARIVSFNDESLVVDLDIANEDGQIVSQVRGLASRRVLDGAKDLATELLHGISWQLDKSSVTAPERIAGPWVVVADRGGLGKRLAERIANATVLDAEADFEKTFTKLPHGAGVVYLASLDVNNATTCEDHGLWRLIRLVQSWELANPGRQVRLAIATRGAQAVLENDTLSSLFQAPTIGLGRVIVGEIASLRTRLVDLDPHADDAGLADLLCELAIGDDEDETAWRDGKRYLPRMLPLAEMPDQVPAPTLSNEPFRLVTRQPGVLDGLTLETRRRSEPEPGEIEIEVQAAGLNFSDVMKALGIYPGIEEKTIPFGAECAGVIARIGPGVGHFRVGQRVLAAGGKSLASHACVKADLVASIPDGMTYTDAASIPIAFLTASYALESLGQLATGERVLIHAATGGVGLAAIQIARHVGAEIYATAGTPEKRQMLRNLGVEHVYDSRSLDFFDRIQEATAGEGIDVVLNSLPGPALVRGLRLLREGGRFLEIGKRDIHSDRPLDLAPFKNNLSFFAIDLDRVMRLRAPMLGRVLRSIMERMESGQLKPLPHKIWPIAESAEAFRFMQQGKHVGKIVLTVAPGRQRLTPAREHPFELANDRTYLITGGLGGFGLAIARFLVQRGAKHLALVGRRGLKTPGARDSVAELRDLGCRVEVFAADLAESRQTADLGKKLDAMPPLAGVVHAAMVLEDTLLADLDRPLLRRVLAPKVAGSWNLHQLTLDRPLDFFVLFSSLSSVFGHAGQANYAAGNAFLDALAWHRRALGLPAGTINWGYVGDVGYLAERPELGERLTRQGVLSFSIDEALAMFEKTIARNLPQASVLRIDRSRWRGLGVTGRASPRFAHLFGEPSKDADSGKAAYLTLSPSERGPWLENLLREKLAKALGSTPAKLDGQRSLVSLGIDSLMAVELRNWVEAELHVSLPMVQLLRSSSLAQLAKLVEEQLDAPAREIAHGPTRSPHVGELPAAQVDAMMASMLTQQSAVGPPR